MLLGKKIYMPMKTKFKRHEDNETIKQQKKRQQDKTIYRLLRQEKEDYVN
jgi:hypothetical protein